MSLFDGIAEGLGSAHEKGDDIIRLLNQQSMLLRDVVERLDAQLEISEYIRKTGATVVAADGTAEISLTVNPGFIVELQGFAATAPVAAGLFAFYMGDSSNGQNLLYATSLSQFLSSSFPQGTVIPENVTLIARFTGQTPGGTVTVAVTGERMRPHSPVAVAGVPY